MILNTLQQKLEPQLSLRIEAAWLSEPGAEAQATALNLKRTQSAELSCPSVEVKCPLAERQKVLGRESKGSCSAVGYHVWRAAQA